MRDVTVERAWIGASLDPRERAEKPQMFDDRTSRDDTPSAARVR